MRLPCPFCGSHKLEENSEYRVKCNSCGAVGPKVYGLQCSSAKWNKRANISKDESDLDKIKEILKRRGFFYREDEACGCIFGLDLKPTERGMYIGIDFGSNGRLTAIHVSSTEKGEIFRVGPEKC